jgi:hypothetical protein
MNVSRYALIGLLVLAFVPATSAAQAHRQGIDRCQTGGHTPGVGVARARDLQLRVAVHKEQAPGEAARVLWTLSLRNRTGRAIEVTFPTDKYADVVLRRKDRAVYAWSRGRWFYPVITSRALAPHETYTCTLGPSELNVDGLEPGRYQQIAFLAILEPQGRGRVESLGWFSIH